MTGKRQTEIRIELLPKTVNSIRRSQYKERAETKLFRAAAFRAAQDFSTATVEDAADSEERSDEDRGPIAWREPVVVVAQVYRVSRRRRDVGAAMIAIKASVDGLVDAGLLADDDDRYVRGLVLLPDVLGADGDRLVLRLIPAAVACSWGVGF